MKKIFMVGCPRSGTTLLQSLLASHEEVVSFPETHLFSKTMHIHWLPRFFSMYGKRKMDIVKYQLKELGVPPDKYEQPDSAFLTSKGWTKELLSILDIIGAHFSSANECYLLEKTPRHLHYLQIIQEVDPEAHFIHIIRRGEDVVASLHEASSENPDEWDGSRDLKKSIFWWNRSIRLSEKFMGKQNHHFVLYADMVNKTEEVVELLFKNLSISVDAKQIVETYHETAPRLITKSESWKSRNTDQTIKRSNKFDRFSERDQKYISEKLIDYDYSRIAL